jgi:hypothetical protein
MSPEDAQVELDSLNGLKSFWENPALDATGWTTQKGNRLLSEDLEKPLTHVNETISSLTPSSLKGTTNLTQEMVDKDGNRITGKAHDKLWSVYAAGEMRKSFDQVVTDSVRVGSTNRNQYNVYLKEMEVYDDKILQEKEREFEEKKLEKKKQAERLAESKKAENKAIASGVQRNKEIIQYTQRKQKESQVEQKKIAARNHQVLKSLEKKFSTQNQVAQNNQKARSNSKNQRKAREA